MTKRYAFILALVLVTILGTISYRNKEAARNSTDMLQAVQDTAAADN